MRRTLLAGLVGLVTGLLVAGFALPAFAQRVGDATDAWDAMHQACLSGDWEAMNQAAQQAHGGIPGGMMGGRGRTGAGGMMGNGGGGMMGGGMMGWR
ncbi:MAG: hypothetical protein HYX92_09055 [Chloroflexi bacterium]|nr:hypothetical protein [Chloroflexota bacterium]